MSDGRLTLVLVKRCSVLQYLRFMASIPYTGLSTAHMSILLNSSCFESRKVNQIFQCNLQPADVLISRCSIASRFRVHGSLHVLETWLAASAKIRLNHSVIKASLYPAWCCPQHSALIVCWVQCLGASCIMHAWTAMASGCLVASKVGFDPAFCRFDGPFLTSKS